MSENNVEVDAEVQTQVPPPKGETQRTEVAGELQEEVAAAATKVTNGEAAAEGGGSQRRSCSC